MQIEIITTEELGDRSYIAHDGAAAVVIDPQRDLDRVEDLLGRLGLTVALVLETHIHNDYVSGGFELARRTSAPYGINADDPVAFSRVALHDGDEVQAGSLTARVLSTPGHTDTHLSYVITDSACSDDPPAVFTGGSLLYGSVGRTDLVDAARTDELTRAQFHSAHRLAALLPDGSPIYPTHGFGSFCSSGTTAEGAESTIGIERRRNDVLTAPDEQSFVDKVVAGLGDYPAYYAHMAPLNRQGPSQADFSPPEGLDTAELSKRIDAGEWVVDLRERVAYAADHLAGTIGIALGSQFATYLGWLVPWGSPLTLIGETAEQLSGAQRQLVRIGIDRPAGAAIGDLDELTGPGQERRKYPRVSFDQVVSDLVAGDVVLDVRRDGERAGGSIQGSLHVPLQSLLTRLGELPDCRLWVHCASGYRASIAASLLDRAYLDVVYVDDDFSHAVDIGLANEPLAMTLANDSR
jgi:glyoxylase-like metal-dependent hydrolase (beta-lactamase superfamily II)/rhodanese-related sulfurtransferase